MIDRIFIFRQTGAGSLWLRLFAGMSGLWLFLEAASGAGGPPPQNNYANIPMTKPVLRQTGPGVFELGEVTLNQAKKTVSFLGEVNMSRGSLEYAIVGDGGKLHESLLRTKAEPFHIHLAILLLSEKRPDPKQEKTPDPPAEDIPAWSTFGGTPIAIWVQLKGDKPEPPVRLESWITQERTGVILSPGPWVYNGSRLIEGRFMAHLERSIVALIEDGFALINNPRLGPESDGMGSPNQDLVPAEGTPVLITLQFNPPAAKLQEEKSSSISRSNSETPGPEREPPAALSIKKE